MTNLSDKILTQIQTKNIHPTNRWALVIKHALIWILTLVAVVIGSLSVAVIIFNFANQDWDIYQRFVNNQRMFVLFILPYFWLALLIIVTIGGHYFFRRTRRGYRYPAILIALIYTITTLTTGNILYHLNIGNLLEESLAHNLKIYNRINTNRAIWTKPEHGLLAGKIIQIEDQRIILIDLLQKKWLVDVGSATGRNNLIIGANIKILGTAISTATFQADTIRPWCGCAGCRQNTHPQSCTEHCNATNN